MSVYTWDTRRLCRLIRVIVDFSYTISIDYKFSWSICIKATLVYNEIHFLVVLSPLASLGFSRVWDVLIKEMHLEIRCNVINWKSVFVCVNLHNITCKGFHNKYNWSLYVLYHFQLLHWQHQLLKPYFYILTRMYFEIWY